MNMEQPVRQTASEQLSYAEVLHWSILLGFIVLVVTFLAYVLGWLPSYVPLERLPQLWGLSATEYLKATGTPTGWSWLFMMNKGDFASQLGIAILSGCSVACIIAIMPAYFKAQNFAYIAICTLEIAVLVLSASGIFGH
jgi:magnesium-transporting ATPase (P-type)